MRSFNKNHEPAELLAFKEKLKKAEFPPANTFEALKDDEDALIPTQLSLADELGWVCVYCQSALKEYTNNQNRKRVIIEIEHYKPKSIFKGVINASDKNDLLCDKSKKFRADLRIEYANLLGACGQNGHCGNAKRDMEFYHIPNPATTRNRDFPIFSYNFKGKIRYKIKDDDDDTIDIDWELKNILNLNHSRLKDKRTGVWKGIRTKILTNCKIKKLKNGGNKEVQLVKDLIEMYENKNGKFYQYYDCAIHLLKREYKDYL
jgi:hypothetical protein